MTIEEMLRRHVMRYHELGGKDWWDVPPIKRVRIIDADMNAILEKLVEDYYHENS